MPSKRSPILGYNHNFVHRGLVFHVQTEDSGVNNPHVFTHLFHGGVILSTRKLDYDAESAEEVVKSLMQAQHKAVLKELKKGQFDDQIESYLGDHPDLTPPHAPKEASKAPEENDSQANVAERSAPAVEEPAAVVAPPPPVDALPEVNSPVPIAVTASGDISVSQGVPAETAPRRARTATASAGDPVVTFRQGDSAVQGSIPSAPGAPRTTRRRARKSTGAYSQVRGQGRGNAPVPVADQPTQPTPHRARSTSRSKVVVSRPAVIIGAPPQVVGKSANEARRRRASADANVFGQDMISEKSLDEVILAYLSDDGEET